MVIPGRTVLLGLATLLIGSAGVAVAATRGGDDAAKAPPAVEVPAVTTTSTVPPTTEAPTTSVPPTTQATGPPTTVRRVTTTVARATTTTTRAPAPTTTAPGPSCTPDQIAVTIVTDRESYAPGQEVKVTGTLRNRSSATCFYNGYRFSSAFTDAASGTFPGVSVIADSFANVAFAPGQAITHSGSWDHRLCPAPTCAPSPPGPYTAMVTWNFAGSTYELTTSFILS